MEEQLVSLAGKSIVTVLVLSAPTVIAGLTVGFMISLFQAVTQIQEQTLTFVPKIITVFLVLLLTGAWMVSTITDFTDEAWTEIGMMMKS